MFGGRSEKLEINFFPEELQNLTFGSLGLDFVLHPFLNEFNLNPKFIHFDVELIEISFVLGSIETLNNSFFALSENAVAVPFQIQSHS